ncbi:hypothetical protein [Clostridium botulinum]|uniref:hypothetical protein n=1 Tax=Clostridium botulinum TaxID=1491 RepID=UPI001C9B34B2|nr:hypothetical protein [Clostridium botulinum]MBY6900435.1 hypothetical protein [Clostridium botulinum]MBY6914722.1 hypothetical protein [Clostridium botulinum]
MKEVIIILKEKWSCYDCIWATDKCKNKDSINYNKFLHNIEKCNFTGECDNLLGCSWRSLEKEI